MTSRYTEWAGPLQEVGRFEWERIIKKCDFTQMSTRLVALLLATYASEDGSRIYPGRERLAAVSGLSQRQVTRSLVKLEDLGLVFKVHNGSSIGKRGLASVYRLTSPSTLLQLYQDDKEELVRLVHELAYDFHNANDQVTPVSLGSSVQGTPVSPASSSDHVTYEADQGTYATAHHVSTTNDLSPSIDHQSIFAASSPKVTHAKEPVDNSGPDLEDERRRQMEALQILIEEERQAS